MTANIQIPIAEQKLNWVNIAFFSAFHIAALVLAPFYFSWQAVLLTVFLHWLFGSIGICLTYHRLLSHRSFQVPKWLEYILTTIGALAVQGGPVFWVGGHRQHHGFTEDNQQDWMNARIWHNPFSYLGKMSYSIFLVHFPISLLFSALFYHLYPHHPEMNIYTNQEIIKGNGWFKENNLVLL